MPDTTVADFLAKAGYENTGTTFVPFFSGTEESQVGAAMAAGLIHFVGAEAVAVAAPFLGLGAIAVGAGCLVNGMYEEAKAAFGFVVGLAKWT